MSDDDVRKALQQYKETTGKWPYNAAKMDEFAESWRQFMPDSAFAKLSWDNVFHGTASMADVVVGEYGGSRQFAAMVRNGTVNAISERCGVLCIYHDQRNHTITISALSRSNIQDAFEQLHKEFVKSVRMTPPPPPPPRKF